MKALGKVVEANSWEVWEECVGWRERVNKGFNQQTRNNDFNQNAAGISVYKTFKMIYTRYLMVSFDKADM